MLEHFSASIPQIQTHSSFLNLSPDFHEHNAQQRCKITRLPLATTHNRATTTQNQPLYHPSTAYNLPFLCEGEAISNATHDKRTSNLEKTRSVLTTFCTFSSASFPSRQPLFETGAFSISLCLASLGLHLTQCPGMNVLSQDAFALNPK